jgi:hypothetical protein
VTDPIMVLPFNVARRWATVSDMQVDVVMFSSETTHVLTHGVLATATGSVDEPDLPSGSRGNDAVEHADHRREPHPGADQHHGRIVTRVEPEITPW